MGNPTRRVGKSAEVKKPVADKSVSRKPVADKNIGTPNASKAIIRKDDPFRKDVIISADGVKHNLIQIRLNYLPSGMVYEKKESNKVNTDMLDKLGKMTEKAIADFFDESKSLFLLFKATSTGWP